MFGRDETRRRPPVRAPTDAGEQLPSGGFRRDLIILDDIGYVKQEPDEIEVLFTLLAERYERRSVAITSNLTFKDWYQIFQNPMTTAAAIDRLVHHSVILEFSVPSYRMEHRDSIDEPTE